MNAVIAPGAGELLTDEPQRQVEVKADRDELAVTESRYAEGESGPDAHCPRTRVPTRRTPRTPHPSTGRPGIEAGRRRTPRGI